MSSMTMSIIMFSRHHVNHPNMAGDLSITGTGAALNRCLHLASSLSCSRLFSDISNTGRLHQPQCSVPALLRPSLVMSMTLQPLMMRVQQVWMVIL
jgi:hypothetical protein